MKYGASFFYQKVTVKSEIFLSSLLVVTFITLYINGLSRKVTGGDKI